MSYTVNRRLLGLFCAIGLFAGCGKDPAAGQPPGGAGTGGQAGTAGGAGGSAGGGAGAGGGGADGTGGAAGATGTAGSGGSGTGGATGSGGATDAGLTPGLDAPVAADGGAARPKTVLLFTRSGGTGYRHESIEPAAAAIRTALMPLGITSEISAELSHFTPTGLSRFGAVVLVSASGSVLGAPGTEEIAAFSSYVKGGGGVMAIHAATAVSYDGAGTYLQIIGGKFIGHPGNIRTTNCYTEGAHPTIMALPAMFSHRDEIYTYSNRRADSQIVVRCDAFGSNEKIPLSWYHREGEGRVFNTGLGHGTELWAAGGRLLPDHVVPAILWTLGL